MGGAVWYRVRNRLWLTVVMSRCKGGKGTAEIIVAKHRNRPTAKVRLAFFEHLTRFAAATDAAPVAHP
jgi:replicative DNA helicase